MSEKLRLSHRDSYFGQVSILLFFLVVLGLFARSADAAVILQYHRISDDGPASTRISKQQFVEHLNSIKRLNYSVVSLDTLASYLRAGQPLPDKTVAITFDDGYLSVYDVAAPLLLANNWPFTIFVSPKDIAVSKGTSLFMNWQQLRELAGKGVLIGNHSSRHEHMVRRGNGETEAQWLQRMRNDILNAQQRIDTEVGKAPRYFAYPYGEYDPPLEQLLRELDYVAVAQHSGAVAYNSSLQALPRFPFGGNYGADDFDIKLQSLPIPVANSELLSESNERVANWILPANVVQPQLLLSVTDANWLKKNGEKKLQCFASGQGQVVAESIQEEYASGHWRIVLNKPVPIGRSKINCTMAAEENRFYWYSQLIIRRNDDGTWYFEP